MKTQVVAALALAAGCAQAFVAPRVGLKAPVAQQQQQTRYVLPLLRSIRRDEVAVNDVR